MGKNEQLIDQPSRISATVPIGAPNPSGVTDNSAAIFSKVGRRIMPFLMTVYVVAFIDRTNIGVAQLAFIKDLHFDAVIYGWGSGLFYLGYALFEVPSNIALAKAGARKVLLTIMILWGIACMALTLISSAMSFYFLRFLLGAAEAGLFPGILLYLTYWVPAERRARFTALFMMAIPLSGVIGSPLAGAIMTWSKGVYGLAGWQWLFLVEGIPAVILGIAAYFYLDNGPADASWLNAGERAAILAAVRNEPAPGRHGSLKMVVFNPLIYVLSIFGIALLVSTAASFLWVPSIIKDSGVKSILDVSLLTAVPFLIGIVFQFQVAKSSDRRGERRLHAAIPAIIGAAGWTLLAIAGANTVLAMIFLSIAVAGTLGAMGPFWTLPALALRGPAVAVGIAVVSTVAGLANFWSPVAVGYLVKATGNLSAGLLYFAALMAVGAASLIFGTSKSQFERIQI